jgi:hypothetical protein
MSLLSVRVRRATCAVGSLGLLALAVPAAHAAEGKGSRQSSPGDESSPASDSSSGEAVRACVGVSQLKVAHAGQRIVVNAPGFLPGQQIAARLLSTAGTIADIRADRQGIAHYQVRISAHPAYSQDVLTLTGLTGSTNPAPAGGQSGNLLVSVPRFAVCRYRVLPR